ncbi:MAG: thiamine pyrophosphate-binding protein [Polyangiaceae bacterium]|nr:thiamine pyrophosphate-binding protein [Polyangiaceae bacterium]
MKQNGGNGQVFGGEIVTKLLAAEGVGHVFGIIDGTYFGLYSTLKAHGIRLWTPRHETSAAHMAGAYARLTGGLGVCMASNGPGVANILPGVAVENAEGNRVLLVTSSRRDGIIYPDRGGSYQYFPQVEVTRPITKWSCAVPSADRIAEVVRRALRVSWEGRPGVVHVDIPENIMNGRYDFDPSSVRAPERTRALEPIPPHPAQVRAAARLLAEAKRPLLHVGSGVVHARAFEEVRALSEVLGAAVTTSWAARAALDERMPNAVPMIFIEAVNRARREADVVVVLGSRVGETDWWGKPPYWGSPDVQKTIQVDLDAQIIGCNRPVDVAVQADVRLFMRALVEELRTTQMSVDLEPRREHVTSLRAACRDRREELDQKLSDRAVPMNPAHVASACQEVFANDAVIVVDGGNTAVWANFFHQVRTPNSLLGTAKMGMLGAGVAQALGAKVARPGKQVYCVIGDGAMGFHPQEIETAVRNQLPVIYLVLADRQWGMVKMNQSFALKPLKTLVMKSLEPEENINSDLGEIEWDALARAMGAHGERVADPAGLKGAIERSLASGKPAVIHVDVDPVKHRWAPELKTFKDMHQEPQG